VISEQRVMKRGYLITKMAVARRVFRHDPPKRPMTRVMGGDEGLHGQSGEVVTGLTPGFFTEKYKLHIPDSVVECRESEYRDHQLEINTNDCHL
jgi:hypothetical protein